MGTSTASRRRGRTERDPASRRAVRRHPLLSLGLVFAAALAPAAAAVPAWARPAPSPSGSGSAPAAQPDADAGTLLVRLGPSRGAAEAALRARGARILREIPGTGYAEVSTGGRPAGTVRAELAASAALADVEPNRIRRATAVPNDPGYALWQASYLEAVDLPDAWDVTGGDDNLVVAVVDTGVQLDHPDLAGRLVQGIDIVNADQVPDDDEGHGTMVAGIIGARTNNATGVAGVAWAGKVMPVKVLDSSGSGTDADVAAGIVWAADHGAKVINLSLGGPGSSDIIQNAVDHAMALNAVVVAAAGNEATDEPQWPAAANGVVAVGATGPSNILATFSNHGWWIDVVAPGVDITSTYIGGGYATGSGTSFASPIVAGIAALARAADPAASAAQIADRVSGNALDLGLPGIDLLFGSGLVDALRTLLPSGGQPSPAPATQPANPTPTSTSGYWMLGADGRVFAFGDAHGSGDPSGGLGTVTATDIEPTPGGAGYWVLDERGSVHNYGDARPMGSLPVGSMGGGETATSLSATPGGSGYWIFTSRGRAFAFGDAARFGDMGATALNSPVIGSVATPSGRGYYMVAADGGIFSFGDARFFGSTGDRRLNQPVRGLVPDPDGTGYWLVAADGGVFAFQAGFRGSMGSQRLNKPVAGMVAYGDGYLMVAADGGIFNFSNKAFVGSLGANPPARPIVAVAALG